MEAGRKRQSFWLPILVNYSIGGLVPLFVFTLGLGAIVLTFPILKSVPEAHPFMAFTFIILIPLMIVDGIFINIAAQIILRHYEMKDVPLITFVSCIMLGLTFFMIEFGVAGAILVAIAFYPVDLFFLRKYLT